jgi:hypothetical protein
MLTNSSFLLILFCITLVIQPISGTNNCNINFFGTDATNWYNITNGFMYGLYWNPPTPCTRCTQVANDMVAVNAGYVNIETLRSTWLSLASLSTLSQIAAMFTVYEMFQSFYIHLDDIYQD